MFVYRYLFPSVSNEYDAVKRFSMYGIAANSCLDIVEVENINQKFGSVFPFMKFI